MTPDFDVVSGFRRDAAQDRQHQPGNGRVVTAGEIGDIDTDVDEIVNGEGAGQYPAAIRQHPRHPHVLVGFVVDFTHDLLEQILEGDDARHATAFADHQRELFTFGEHPVQCRGDPDTVGQAQHRARHVGDRAVGTE